MSLGNRWIPALALRPITRSVAEDSTGSALSCRCSEENIGDRSHCPSTRRAAQCGEQPFPRNSSLRWVEVECFQATRTNSLPGICLLYTSDAADDLLCVDLGG